MTSAQGMLSGLQGSVPWIGPGGETAILAAILVDTLLYGMHVILFIVCLYFLIARRMRLLWIMLAGIIIMFLLASVDVGISFHALLWKTQWIVGGPKISMLLILYPKFLIYVTNNLISVSLQIARFYVVWGQKKYLLVPTVLPLLTATGFGYAIPVKTPQKLRRFMPVYFIISLVLNTALTLLTAGRIWWISRKTTNAIGSRYRLTSAILVESGVLYSGSMIMTIALATTPWVAVAAVIMLRMVCIVPVLMIVQIAIGHSTPRPPQNKTADINTYTNAGARTSVMLDTIIRSGQTGLGDSSMELTSHGSSIAGHGLELQQRTRRVDDDGKMEES